MSQGQTEFYTNTSASGGSNPRRDLRDPFRTGKNRSKPHSRLYSRFVTLMKLVLPGLALIVIALVIAWPHLNTSDIGFRLGFAAMQLNDAEDPSMINPRYVGTDNDNQPFSLTADLARNLSGPGTRVELEMPKADITTTDGAWLVLTAENGIYTRNQKTLKLVGKVNLFHDQGYEFRTERALIDLAKGTANSNDPVEGQGTFGHLKANGFQLFNKGRTILFRGKSTLVFYPKTKGKSQ